MMDDEKRSAIDTVVVTALLERDTDAGTERVEP